MHVSGFFKAVLEASWQGSLVIALILLLRPLLGRSVPARWRSWLWMLVLLRLLVPAFLLPPSPTSLQNLAVVSHPLEKAGIPLEPQGPLASPVIGLVPQGPDATEFAGPAVEPAPPVPTRPSWWRIAGLTWLSGAVATGAWIITATIFLHRRLRRDSTPLDDHILQLWKRCCARLSIQRPPRLIATDCVASPALVGLLHPTLLLPRANPSLSIEDWEHIFLHELAHFRRRDHWLQAFQLVALCAHWFNPFVWLSFRYLRADRELAADEWALRHLEADRPHAYGQTLLKVLTAHSQRVIPLCMIGIGEDATQMMERLRHIVAFGRRRLVGSIAGAAVVIGLAAMVLGRNADPEADLTDFAGLAPAEILVSAAGHGNPAVVEKMLAQGVDANAIVSVKGQRTPLTAAVASNHLAIARLLVEKGANINLAAEKADAPITVALKNDWPDCASYLLEKGAVCPPARLAAAKGDAATVEKLVATEPSNFDELKILCEIAAANGQIGIFRTLYDAIHFLPAHAGYEAGNSVAAIAMARGHRAVVEEIISRESSSMRGVARFSAAAAHIPGMREWLRTKNFEVPEYSDGERLIDAAERDDVPEIHRLLKAGVDVSYRGESDWTPITKAATWGCPKAVKLLLENHADPNATKHSHSALRLAKTAEIADLLFAAGADVNARIGDDHIISYCVIFGPVEMVRWFLDHGVDPLKVKTSEPTLLFNAGNPEIARLLIERGVDVHTRNQGGETALDEIARFGRNAAETMRVLLKSGADPNARDKFGATPLMKARDGACVDVLVEYGADLTATNEDGYSVLTYSSHMANASRLESLLRHGLRLDAKTGPYLLAHAASSRQIDVVKFLLEHGVDPNVKSPMNLQTDAEWAPLNTVIYPNSYAIAKLLVEHGADATGRIASAAAIGRPQLVRLFWESGFHNISELCYAVTQSTPAAGLEALIAKAGTANPPEDQVVTPLGAAAVLGDTETVKFLISHGADPNAGQRSAVAISAEQGQDQTLAYLLDHGGKATPRLVGSVAVNSNPYEQEAPIENFNRIMKHLLDHGALDGCTDEQAADVLIAATLTRNPGGNPAVIRMLLEHGLNVHARTSRGTYFGVEAPAPGTTQSVLDVIPLAEKSGCWRVKPEVTELLQKAGTTQPAQR